MALALHILPQLHLPWTPRARLEAFTHSTASHAHERRPLPLPLLARDAAHGRELWPAHPTEGNAPPATPPRAGRHLLRTASIPTLSCGLQSPECSKERRTLPAREGARALGWGPLRAPHSSQSCVHAARSAPLRSAPPRSASQRRRCGARRRARSPLAPPPPRGDAEPRPHPSPIPYPPCCALHPLTRNTRLTRQAHHHARREGERLRTRKPGEHRRARAARPRAARAARPGAARARAACAARRRAPQPRAVLAHPRAPRAPRICRAVGRDCVCACGSYPWSAIFVLAPAPLPFASKWG